MELEFGGEVEHEDSVLERDFAIGADDEVFVLFAEFLKGRREGFFGDVLAVDLVFAAFSDGKEKGFLGTRLCTFSGGEFNFEATDAFKVGSENNEDQQDEHDIDQGSESDFWSRSFGGIKHGWTRSVIGESRTRCVGLNALGHQTWLDSLGGWGERPAWFSRVCAVVGLFEWVASSGQGSSRGGKT